VAKKNKHQQLPREVQAPADTEPFLQLTPRDVTLPRRQPPHGYVQADLRLHHIPAPF
jgi:hypothetical protein